jgi:hypothetical protein
LKEQAFPLAIAHLLQMNLRELLLRKGRQKPMLVQDSYVIIHLGGVNRVVIHNHHKHKRSHSNKSQRKMKVLHVLLKVLLHRNNKLLHKLHKQWCQTIQHKHIS